MNDTQHATADLPVSMDDAMQNINNDHDGKQETPVHDKVTPIEQDDTQAGGKQSAVGTTSAASMQLQDMADKALHFLSHASNETIGACIVGLATTTYFVLGRVGLVLMGIVGGVALHATWDASHSSSDRLAANEAEQRKRREVGLDVVRRLLLSREEQADKTGTEDSEEEVRQLASTKADFSSFRPDTQAALNVFTNAVIRDYVKYEFRLSHYSMILTDNDTAGGTRLSSLAKTRSPRPAVRSWLALSFPSPTTSPASDPSIPSSIS
jgi:hypothetical protein